MDFESQYSALRNQLPQVKSAGEDIRDLRDTSDEVRSK